MADPFEGQPQQFNAQSFPSQSRPPPANHDAAPAAPLQREADGIYVPRAKRIACVVCRRRKLRCDGKRPSCGTCSRLGHECAYDEVRKKSGPKRGYVKKLEARLAQVENLLKKQEPDLTPPEDGHPNLTAPNENDMARLSEVPSLPSDMDGPMSRQAAVTDHHQSAQPPFLALPRSLNIPRNPGWDMISLGLEEPLPIQDVIDELNQIYFEKIHPLTPLLHRPKYMASMSLTFNLRPPVCLQYITWCLAASVTEKYLNLHGLFYQRARKYAELDEMKGIGEYTVSLVHCQTWILITTYEFKMMYFPRTWLSGGKAVRMALMMGLHRLDGAGSEVNHFISPTTDWTEKEERRRAFWMIFCIDRYGSAGTGWPAMIDERDIMTDLPATEESFVKCKPLRTLCLNDVIRGEGISTLSPFASVVMLACMFGRNLTHLHRSHPQDNDHDLNGEFWKRHRSYDNILLHFALTMPNHLRLPVGIDNPAVVFCNMLLQTVTIFLHQTAIFKAEKNKMPDPIIIEGKRRCIIAADQIARIMKMISHTDLSVINPYMSFCVYAAARVFVQYLKSRPDDLAARSTLQFFFSCLEALKNTNPMAESLLVHLDVEIEGTDLRNLRSGDTTGNVQQRTSIFKPMGQWQQPVSEESSNPSNNALQSCFHSTASHPGRQRRTSTPHLGPGTTSASRVTQAFMDTSYNLSSVTDTGGSGTATDMDPSPGYSGGGNNPLSDDSPSSGLKLPTNTSFVGVDHPSSLQEQQQSSTNYPSQGPPSSLENDSLLHMPPVTTDPGHFGGIPYPNRVFSAETMVPLNPAGLGASFPVSSTWDIPQNNNNIGPTHGGMESLSEEQWAQLLRGTSWDAWQC